MPITGAEFETKHFEMLECKMSEEGPGSMTGYASIKNVPDQIGDMVCDGAYFDLEDFKRTGWSGRHHAGDAGMIMEAVEDAKGLLVTIEFYNTTFGQETRQIVSQRLKAGKAVGMSIMYKILEKDFGEIDGRPIRFLKKLLLKEAGFVNLPINTVAEVTGVKGGAGSTLTDQVKASLEMVDDLKTRLEFLHADRKNGLSDERKGQVQEISISIRQCADKWDEFAQSLAPAADPEAPEPVDEIEVMACRDRLRSSGVTI